MKIVKKATALFLSLTMILLLSFSATAATNRQVAPYGINGNDIIIQPFYVNINTTYLSRGSTWICADLTTKSKMSLRIDIKVYKNGSLDLSDYTTANDSYCVIDVDYKFIKGVSYRIDATYKAGTETVPKSMSFTA